MCDNIIGFLKYNGNNNYYVNNFVNAMNKNSDIMEEYSIKLNNIEDILKKFNYLIFQTNFSSKYLYLDELTGKKYRKEEIFESDNKIYNKSDNESDNESDNGSINSYNTENSEDNNYEKSKNIKIKKNNNLVRLVSKKIIGSNTFFFYPRGFIQFNSKNKLLYDCLEYQFHFDKLSIPIKYTNLDTTKPYKVRRSNGIIHDCFISSNYSIRFSKTTTKYVIENHFNEKNTDYITNYNKKYHDNKIYDLIKTVLVKEFLELNEIDKINISIPLLNEDNYDLNNLDISFELSKELINYYNYEIKKYEEDVFNKINK